MNSKNMILIIIEKTGVNDNINAVYNVIDKSATIKEWPQMEQTSFWFQIRDYSVACSK